MRPHSSRTGSANVYIAAMSGAAAQERFPAIRGLPADREVFLVVSELGDPLLVMATRAEALRQVGQRPRFMLRTCH